MAAASNPPVIPEPWSRNEEGYRLFCNFQPWDIYFDVVAGSTAGNLTVNGTRTRDILLTVIDLYAGTCLTHEFTIKASDTLNNDLGTSSSGHQVMVAWVHVP
jgi:hypothetical protein